MHPDRQVIYQAVIQRMVTESLNQKEEQFAAEHVDDSDAMLLNYLRKCAVDLGHTPHSKEIVGWRYITERFGTWEHALRKARLPWPHTPGTVSKFQLVIDETQFQQKLYRQKKAEKKQKQQQRIQQQAQKRKQSAQITEPAELK